MKQLLTSEDFTAAQRGGGLIGIFDKHTGDRLHLLPCSFVRQEYFYEKVVRRGGKNGRYVLYESIDEIPAELRDQLCPYCWGEVTSVGQVTSTPEFKKRLRERASAPATRPAPATVVGADSSGDPVIRWTGGRKDVVEGWCSRQLDLESKPPDVRGLLRLGLREKLRDMSAALGQILAATYAAPALLPRSDVENVLFTNIDATGGAFARLAAHGVWFEHEPIDPSRLADAPQLSCRSVYRVLAEADITSAWHETHELARWERVPVPSFMNATRSAPLWWDLRRGAAELAVLGSRPDSFGVHLVLHVPEGARVNCAAKLKVAVDAVVLAFSCADGNAKTIGIEKFAADAGAPEDEVRALLASAERAVLGACRMVNAGGSAEPPDEGCHQGSLRLDDGSSDRWLLSGRIVSLARA